MFEHHFGLRENPFPAGHLLKFVYPSREHQEARAHLRYGIENREPFLLITGEVGTGKTTSLYDALNEWGDRVAVALITNSSLTRQEMLEEICLRFGLQAPPGTSKPALLVMLEKHLVTVRARGEHAVLMMDEAQNLSMDLLEEIRLLSNLEHKGEKLLQIFLVGQPELEAHLARHELRQLRQRITVHYRLNPLSSDETLGYIHHHINVAGGNGAIVFPPDTCLEIYRFTHGIPREINTLASSALIAAYADGSPSVRGEHVGMVAHEGDFRSVLSSPAVKPADTPLPMPAPPPAPARHAAAAPPLPPPPPPVQSPYSVGHAGGAPQYSHTPLAPVPPPPPPAAVAPPAPPIPIQRPQMAPPPPPPPPPAPPAPPAHWTMVQQLEDMQREAAQQPPPPPTTPWREREPFAEPRERGEVSRGIVAAMSHRGQAPPPPPGAPPRRASFATPPQPPLPLPIRPEQEERFAPQALRATALPGRLQEKLQAEIAREESVTPSIRNWLIAVSVIATIGVMLILMQRFGAIDVPFLRGAAGAHATRDGAREPQGALATPTEVDPTAALIDSLKREVETAKANVRPAASAQAPGPRARVTSPASTGTRSTPAPPRATATPNDGGNAEPGNGSASAASRSGDAAPATRPAPTPAVSTTHFGIGVVSYLDQDRANQESQRLSAETVLPSVVMPYRDSGTIMYRVVIGRWTNVAEAERNANTLMERGVINEARVVTVPK